jgi:uncharacterized membrane protein
MADPLEATARNFVYSVPLVLIVSVIFIGDYSGSSSGLALAAASGAIASGCGYVIWYAALRGLTATRAATVQLSVPVIATFGGVLLLSEEITLRLLLASAASQWCWRSVQPGALDHEPHRPRERRCHHRVWHSPELKKNGRPEAAVRCLLLYSFFSVFAVMA